MKKVINIILLALLLVQFTSCDSFLDVNVDKTNPSTAPYEYVFPAAVTSTAAVVGGQYSILGSLWAQHFTQSNTANQYKVLDGCSLTSSNFNESFNELYSGALNDYKQVLTDAEKAGDWNTYLMATVMQSYTYQILADLYDKIPYTESLGGVTSKNISPKYDEGTVVYDGLIVTLDRALAKDFTATTNKSIAGKDLVFGGDVTKWKKFANTLKLKIYLRQVYARPAVAQAGIAKLYADGAQFLDTNANLAVFTEEVKKQNPLYGSEVQYLGNSNLRASKTLFDYLNSTGDSRLNKIYKPGTGGHKALAQGDYLASSVTYPNGSLSSGLFAATDPVYFISVAESYFLQAEALLRYPALGGDVKIMYDKAVDAAFKRLSLSDGPSFTAANAAYDFTKATTVDDKLNLIITQKWIASALVEPIEAFFDYNRTGKPAIFTVPVNSAIKPSFAQRLLFTLDERSRNPNTPAQVNLDVPVWWAKKY